MNKIFPPSRCTATLPLDLEKPHLIGECKMDGSRYVLYLGENVDPYERQAGNVLLSRHISVRDGKHVDRTENIPHITGQSYPGLEGTVLDGEIMSSDFLKTNSIMNSGPRLAVQKQETNGYLNYHVFDCMAFRGEDIRGLPLEKRRKVLEEVAKRMSNEYVRVIPQFKSDLVKHFTSIVENGGEGIIVKDLHQGYGCGWAKLKKSYDLSCICSGWKPGNGKYSEMIGSIALSVFHGGKLVEVGFASGFNDALRKKMSDNFSEYEGKVVDIFAQEVQKKDRNGVGRLRHPTFYRFRDDVEPSTITSEKLHEDLNKRVRSNRNKWSR